MDVLDLRLTIFEVPKLQQLLRIIPANLLLVRIIHLDIIVPITTIGKVLERVIDRKENAICSNFPHTELQSRSREVSAGCDPKVLLKVLADSLLAREAERLLDVFEPVVDSPHVEGDVFSQVAKNDLELGMAVKDTICDHTKNVQAYALGKAQRRSDKP